jgi:hypothetical protein
MDAVLQVLDVVTRMFNEIRAGVEPAPADPALLTVAGGTPCRAADDGSAADAG